MDTQNAQELTPVPETTDQEREDLCLLCGERAIDRTENPDAKTCAGCQAKHLPIKAPIWVQLCVVLALALLIQAFVSLPKAAGDQRQLAQAEAHMAMREYQYAANQYVELLEVYGDSKELATRALEAAVSAQNFEGAYWVLDTYLFNRDLDDNLYQRVYPLSELTQRVLATSGQFGVILKEATAGMPENASDEETKKMLADIRAQAEAMLGDPTYEPAIVLCHLAMIAEDGAQASEYLRRSIEANDRISFTRSLLGTQLRRAGRLEEARQAYADGLRLNALDFDSLRGQSVLEMLEGRKEEALVLARRAYEIAPKGEYIAQTLCVALVENGLAEEADAVEALARDHEVDFDADGEYALYREGKVSLRDYYVKGEEAIQL